MPEDAGTTPRPGPRVNGYPNNAALSKGVEMCTELLNAETGVRPTEKLELVG